MNQIEDTKERSMPSLAGSLPFRKLPEGTIGKWKCTIVLLRIWYHIGLGKTTVFTKNCEKFSSLGILPPYFSRPSSGVRDPFLTDIFFSYGFRFWVTEGLRSFADSF